MNLRKCLLSVLATGLATCLLTNFVSIWVFGKYYIYESNRLILGVETLLMVGIIVFGLFSFFSDLRSRTSDIFNEQ